MGLNGETMPRQKTILFYLNGFKLADLWLKARMMGIGLNEMIILEFKKEIKRKTKSKLILPKIVVANRRVAETIVGVDLSNYFATEKEVYGNYIKIGEE